MAREITSKHLIGATELTVSMPIRQGFVDIRDTVTYATRLRFMLRILNTIRKASRESVIAREYVGPIERLRTINDARFGIIENDTKLLLSVSFDEPWEPYIRTIRDDAGPLLDAICSHCEGYTREYRSGLGYEQFAEWVRKHQVDVDFFYSAQPALTTDDFRYLKKLEVKQRQDRNIAKFDRTVPETFLLSPLEEAQHSAKSSLYADPSKASKSAASRNERLIRQGLRAVKAMYSLDRFYPDNAEPGSDEELERHFWIQAAQAVLKQFDSRRLVPPGSSQRRQYQHELIWFETDVPPEKFDEEREPRPERLENLQGNILRPYRAMSYGVLVLIGFASAETGKEFLKTYREKITSEEGSEHVEKAFNLGITRHGLRTLDLPSEIYRHFPKEFREGMEERSGMLGDIRENHPLHWKLPDWNWPLEREIKSDENTVKKVPLATVDIVVEIQASLREEDSDSDQYKFHEDSKYLTMSKDHPMIGDIEELDSFEGVCVLSVQPLRRKYRDSKTVVDDERPHESRQRFIEEHFGFADGISQPIPTDCPNQRHDVSFGELLRGYVDDKGERCPPSSAKETADWLMKDGSFLVIRKLRQYVGRFNEFVNRESELNHIGKEKLMGKLMGRTRDGRPVFPVSHIQEFDFQSDAKGHDCPFQAHIRRTNPRLPPDPQAKPDQYATARKQVPRIMRRGFSYGPRFSKERGDDVDRGLFFMSYSASIAEQYEVIQRWIAGGNSTGVLSAHDDPLLGVPPPKGEDRTFRFHHDTHAARCSLGNDHFVELQWGMYLFVPAIAAIDELTTEIRKSDDVSEGITIIENLQRLERALKNDNYTTIQNAWKTVLEDKSSKAGGVTAALWAAIRRKCEGRLNTPYGLLIGTFEEVTEAFNKPDPYSVREFWFRMRETIGAGFLGMDPIPKVIDHTASDAAEKEDRIYRKHVNAGDYGAQSTPANAEISKVTQNLSYPAAREFMRERIDDERNCKILDLRRVAGLVMMKLCKHYFGVPRRPDPDMINNFVFAARYIFSSPRPTEFLERQAWQRGKAEFDKIHDFVKQHRKKPYKNVGLISKELFSIKDIYPNNKDGNEYLAKTIAGLSNGMIAPTLGSFLSMMFQLISSERLWRVQQHLLVETKNRDSFADIEDVIVPVILEAMYSGPVPDIVHRTNTETVEFKPWAFEKGELEDNDPDLDILRAGSRIILGIESATRDTTIPKSLDDADVIFGGKYVPGNSTGTHACSGARMGIGILAGMLTALLESGNLKLENAPLTLSRNLKDEHAID